MYANFKHLEMPIHELRWLTLSTAFLSSSYRKPSSVSKSLSRLSCLTNAKLSKKRTPARIYIIILTIWRLSTYDWATTAFMMPSPPSELHVLTISTKALASKTKLPHSANRQSALYSSWKCSVRSSPLWQRVSSVRIRGKRSTWRQRREGRY